MGENLIKRFEKIAEAAIQKAQRVDCATIDYIEGLKYMIELLQEELAAAKECQR